MASKKPAAKKQATVDPNSNFVIRADLRRRLKAAQEQTGKPIKTLLMEWIKEGLDNLETGVGNLSDGKPLPSFHNRVGNEARLRRGR